MRILLAEDQRTLNSILTERLQKEGYTIDATFDGDEAVHFINATSYDLLILDVMMPKRDGLSIIEYVRKKQLQTPIILLTARDSISDRVKGLDSGADDYLVKPFSYDELLARIRVLLRRQPKSIQTVLRVADLELNRTTNEVKRDAHVIKLSKKEYALLEYLMLHKGEVVTRESLERVSTSFDYEGYSNVIDVYIRFLRKKIDDDFDIKLIHTIRGFGYTLKEVI